MRMELLFLVKGRTPGLSPNGKTAGEVTARRTVASAPVPAGMKEEIRHVEHPLRHALDMVCQHRKLVYEDLAKRRSYPRLSTSPPATMTRPPSSQPKGISPLRQGGYPLRGKGDIHFRTKGISLFTARGYPLSCKGDIHFQTKGISLLAARRGACTHGGPSLN